MGKPLTNIAGIHRLVATTRHLLRFAWIATGMAVAVGVFVATLLVVTMADVAFPLWPLFRFLGLLAITGSTAWILVIGVLRPLCRRLTDVTVARRIEAEIPGIRNRLVSCVDLARQDPCHVVSPAFHRRLVAEAQERVQHFSPRRVVDAAIIRRAGLFAVASVALMILSFAVFSSRLPTAVARILKPFADIPPVSRVAFDVLVGDRNRPGDYEILRGEDVQFTVVINQGEIGPPGRSDSLRLEVQTIDEKGGSKSLRYAFPKVQNQRAHLTLSGMRDSFTYRVHGGRTWTRTSRVTMLQRPRIVGLRTVLHYPDYMMNVDPLHGPPQVEDIEGPVGSTVEVIAEVEGDAVVGEIELLQPSTVEASQQALSVADRLSLSRISERASRTVGVVTWTGRFPLQRDGFFRVAFRNRLRYPSQPIEEVQITAIPDLPPQILIERPGRDLVVSAPMKVPLFVSAFDDFGIQTLTLCTQHESSDDIVSQPVRTYEEPLCRDSCVVTLDLVAQRLRSGRALRYWLQARDSKGQEAKSSVHEIRITDTDEAADRQFANFRAETEALQEKLDMLIDVQAEIQQSVHQMDEQPSSLSDELTEAAIRQNKNLEFAGQVAASLTRIARKSRDVPWLPEELLNHLQSVDQAFEPLALQPMQGLKDLLEQAALPDREAPQLSTIRRRADLLQENLEDLRHRMQALIRAQRHDWEDIGQALTELEQDLLKQNADLVARELAELGDFVDALRDDLQRLEGLQEDLIDEGEQELTNPAFERFLQEQAQLDAEASERLSDTKELLNSDQLRELRDQLEAELKRRGDEATKPAGKQPGQGDNVKGSPASDDSRTSPGERPQGSRKGGQRDPQLDQLQAHQRQQADELRQADGSLAAAQQKLEQLLGQYDAQLPSDALSQLSPEQINELADLMRSESTEDALDMFQRMRKMLADAEAMRGPNRPGEAQDGSSMDGHMLPPPSSIEDFLLQFGDLDPSMRTTIMKMQPKAREELLQGLREEGPEGYRQFIRDYFRKLTRAGTE